MFFEYKEENQLHEIEKYVTSIPDFPEPGIIFRDVTTVIGNAEGLKLSVDALCDLVKDVDFDVIVGLEARGFLFGMPMAYLLGKPFIPVRKKGKLPRETVEKTYDLEYGSATIEVHKEDIQPGARVVLVDDLLATGGTFAAAAALIASLGGIVVKAVCLMELKGLNGREKLQGLDVASVIQYDGK